MASLNALPTAGVGEVLVKIRVDYQGGLGADRFVELAWSFSRYGGGNLNVVKDNGIAGVEYVLHEPSAAIESVRNCRAESRIVRPKKTTPTMSTARPKNIKGLRP